MDQQNQSVPPSVQPAQAPPPQPLANNPNKALPKWPKIIVMVLIIIICVEIGYISFKNYQIAGAEKTVVRKPSVTPATEPTPTATLLPTVVLPTKKPIVSNPPTQSKNDSIKTINIKANVPTATPVPIKKYTISGYVYKDDNGNQSRDSGEQTFSGATVVFLSLGKTIYTDGSGKYSLGDLVPGQYNITVNGPGGMNSNTPNPSSVTITNNDVSTDFGFVPDHL